MGFWDKPITITVHGPWDDKSKTEETPAPSDDAPPASTRDRRRSNPPVGSGESVHSTTGNTQSRGPQGLDFMQRGLAAINNAADNIKKSAPRAGFAPEAGDAQPTSPSSSAQSPKKKYSNRDADAMTRFVAANSDEPQGDAIAGLLERTMSEDSAPEADVRRGPRRQNENRTPSRSQSATRAQDEETTALRLKPSGASSLPNKIPASQGKNVSNPFNNGSEQFDGVIGPFKQGEANDCGLLAAVRSLAETKTGAQILKNAITRNSDGSITVRLHSKMPMVFGEYVEYKYSPQEILQLKGLSSGDPDVRAIEKAMKDYRVDKFHVIDTTRPEEAFLALTGKKGDYLHVYENNNSPENMLNDIKNNKGQYAAVAGLPTSFGLHAFSVTSFDGNTVTLVDPMDSSKSFTMPKNKFLDKLVTLDSIYIGR